MADVIKFPETDQILDERAKTHGPYPVKAQIIQDLKAVMRRSPGWDKLPDVMKESLDMECHKNGRILSGDPYVIDHWDDKAGYARLVSKWLKANAG
jgi:hypothetical protein